MKNKRLIKLLLQSYISLMLGTIKSHAQTPPSSEEKGLVTVESEFLVVLIQQSSSQSHPVHHVTT
jgi:hypothetical protein